jgi:hypothetical protein
MIAPVYLATATTYTLLEDATLSALVIQGTGAGGYQLGLGADSFSSPVIRTGTASTVPLYIPLKISLKKGAMLTTGGVTTCTLYFS